MITQFEAQSYGPLKHVSCALTPLHAFIGPNDSGKSTLLRAIVTGIQGSNTLYWPVRSDLAKIVLRFKGPGSFAGVAFNGASLTDIERSNGSRGGMSGGEGSAELFGSPSAADAAWMNRGARVLRFEPDSLRRQTQLLPESQLLQYLDTRGVGIPAVYDALNNRNDGSFKAISDDVLRLFPTVARLRLLTVSTTEKMLAVDLKDGTTIPATSMSEGLLYYLAYAALTHLKGVALVGVEEPESGLHPARIAEVVRILRRVSESGTQVIIATHSPLLVNELQPGEVSVVTRRPESGTQVRPIAQTPNFEKRSKIYALGELWLSYANGMDEAPLLEGKSADVPSA